MSEEKNVSEEKIESPAQPGGEAKSVDELLNQHVHRWQQRAQVIVALVAVFLLYMIYFMMHE